MLQKQLYTAWSNADSAAVSFTVQVFTGSAGIAPAIADGATTELVRCSGQH
jgi:hypothetical protein